MKDEQTRLAIEALEAAGCGVLAINIESRITSLEQDNQEQCRLNAMGAERAARLMARVKELEKDAARKGWNPEHVAKAWYAMGLDVAGFSWGAFAYKVKDEQDTAMQKD